ncbi:hypothetical protein LCGC14_2757550 [marine sediment metagenome]|uniref:Uncharacterized protein n=1 Tax=marine sediment metagenome TaxID=412755 RepID=A0A0F8Z005_9ZZZZ|nr:hypothetical protein [Phycisphaerales bacterium]
MKRVFVLVGLLFLMGCQPTAKLDDFQIGMPLCEVQSLTTLEKIRENQDSVTYRCKLETGIGSMLKYGSIFAGHEPYKFTFDKKTDSLTEVEFDQSTANIRHMKTASQR